MKFLEVFSSPKINTTVSKVPWKSVFSTLLILMIIVGMGIVLAYLNASGDWVIAGVIMAVVPAVVLLHRYPFLGLLVWLLLTPFLLQSRTEASRYVYWIIHRFLPVISVIFLVTASTFGVKNRKLPKLTIVEYSIIGYIMVSVLSIILWNNTPEATFYRFYDLLIIPMVLFFLIRLYVPSEKSLQLLVPIALFITVTQVTVGVLSWVYPYVLPSHWLTYAGARTIGTLSSVSVYTTTLFFSGLILLNLGLQTTNKWKRYLFVSMFFLMVYATFISYSRASWLAGILILAGVFILYPKFMSKVMIAGVVVMLALGSVLFSTGGFQTAVNRFSSDEADQSALSRLPVFLAAYRMFEEKPILGWGYDNFDRFDRRYQTRVGQLVNPDEKDHTSHNIYLTMLAEQGLVGITLYLLPFANLLWHSRKTLQYLPKRGMLSNKMFISMWLVILSFFIVQNFAPMVVVFGMGLNWITLGLIANTVHLYKHR